MGDLRFSSYYDRVASAEDPVLAMRTLSDAEVIAALAGASRGHDPYLANVLATEALNRIAQSSAVFGALGEGVCAVDARGRATFANPAASRLLQRPAAEIVGSDLHELVHGAHAGSGSCPLERALAGDAAREREDSFRRGEGGTIAVEWNVAPILRDDEPRGAVLTFADARDRQRAETTRAWLAAIVQSSDDAILGKTLDGIVVSWNAAAERMYGYTAEEVIGRHVSLLEPPERAGEISSIMAALRRGEAIHHMTTKRITKDGRVLDVSLTVSPIRDGEGRLVGASATARKIGRDSPDAGRARSISEARILAESMPLIVAAADGEGRMVYLGPRWGATTGLSPEESLGWSWLEAVHPRDRDRLLDRWTEALAAGDVMEARARLRCANDGTHRWHEIRFVPVPETQGERRWLGVMIDADDGIRAEAELRASRDWLGVILSGAADSILALDEEGRILFANGAAHKALGAPAAGVVGQRIVELVEVLDEESRPIALERTAVAQAQRERRPVERLHAYRLKPGGPVRWVVVRATPVEGMTISIAHDVTDRRLLAQAADLRASLLARAGAAFGEAPDEAAIGAALLDLAAPALAERARLLRDGERAPEGALEIAAPPLGRLALEEPRRGSEGLAAELAQRAALAARNARALASERAARADAEGALRAVYASMRALRESKERFASLVEAIAQIVWTAGPDGTVMDSRQWEAYTGMTPDAIAGRRWLDAIHPDDREAAKRAWARAREAGEPYLVESRIRRADGVYRVFALRAVPVREPDGRVREWVGTCTDVTERVAAKSDLEARVRERTRALEAANRELEAFSSAVSHDLRAPLRGVNAYAEVLEERAELLDAEGRDALARLRADVRRMGGIIEDLLGLSRAQKEEIRRERVDLASIARESVARLRAADPSREVEVAIEEPLPADADPRAMRILLDNLLGNAWKFTKATPKPRIEVASQETPEGRVYRVADNGAGFDMAQAGRLFRPFQRLHGSSYEGTGLGLATVARLVERHGGRVWAKGEPGRGATIFFTLGPP